MAQRLVYEGREFPLITSPTMGEVIWAEKALGCGIDEWTTTQRGVAMCALSLRRAQVMLTIPDVLDLPADAFNVIGDDEDPTTPGAEAGEPEDDETPT